MTEMPDYKVIKYTDPGRGRGGVPGNCAVRLAELYVSIGGPDKGKIVAGVPGKQSVQSEACVEAIVAQCPGVQDVLAAARTIQDKEQANDE